MSQEMSISNNQVSKEVVEAYLFSCNQKLTPQQKAMFLNLALQFNLNPFKREIYAIQYGSGWNYVTGYQVYIARAERTGLLNGWSVEAIKDGNTLIGARATIYRKDWDKPFVWEVAMAEFNRQSPNWKSMPEFMIKKVCMAQAFRLCFTNDFKGMPYIAEEIESKPFIEEPKVEPIEKIEVEPIEKIEVEPIGFMESIRVSIDRCETLNELKDVWSEILKNPQYIKLTDKEKIKIRNWKEIRKEAFQATKPIPEEKTTQVEI